ncbi:uncharacterized protein [Neodiprion pinetum]|uniref:uncharacterized protein isoform X2 n=1 Tax=Neodiprion pinetum TaxID=441929 RepID=UPI00371E8C09
MNCKGLNVAGQHPVSKVKAYSDIERLLESDTNYGGDDLVQFEADQFISDQFCMTCPKKKRVKEKIKGLTESVAFQEHMEFEFCFPPQLTDDRHYKQNFGTMEDANDRILNILQDTMAKQSSIGMANFSKVEPKEIDSLLRQGYEAYRFGNYGLASTKYRTAWEIINDATVKVQTRFINEDVICYMLCVTLLETNQLNNLSESVELLISLEKRSSHVLPAVYFALSKAHHKHYRFALALKTIEEGFAFLRSGVELPLHTIPGSNIILPESTRDGLSVSLADMKEECSKWHPPDAVCCLGECVPSSRLYSPNRNIYFSDPAFSGMVVVTCSNNRNPCTIKFHQACWKLKKDQLSAVKKLSDKDIIGCECFTPNCVYGQGERSLITKVEVYGDNGKLKTCIGAPANPVVWVKRRYPSKGAIPRQLDKPKRHSEKIRRPGIITVPRSICKEATGEDCVEKAWRLAQLSNLRENNFGIKSDCEWRPDAVMYGNPQMVEIGDFLGGPIFENDCSQMAAVKTFIFTYFYEFIKENGCVKKQEISQKWEEDKFVFDNYSNALNNETDISDFLLQSYKLVSLGDYIGVAETLPELFAVVRSEVCGCLKFLLADPLRSRTAIIQDDVFNLIIGDYEEKQNRAQTMSHGYDTDTDTDKMMIGISASPVVADSHKIPLPTYEARDFRGANKSMEDHDRQQSRDDNTPWMLTFHEISSPTNSTCSNDVSNVVINNVESNHWTVTENSADLGATLGVDHCHEMMQKINLGDEIENDPNRVQADCESAVNNCQDDAVKLKNNSMTDTSYDICNTPEEPEVIHSVNRDPATDPAVCKVTLRRDMHQSSALYAFDMNCSHQEIEVPFDRTSSKLAHIHNACSFDLDEAKPKGVCTDRTDTRVQNLEKELTEYKMVSSASMSELVKDSHRLEVQCSKLESEKSQIMEKIRECQLDLRRCTEDNVTLKLKNTELMHKYDKLFKEKTEIEHNFNVLLREKSAIENRLGVLEKERNKTDKKLQKYELHQSDSSNADLNPMDNGLKVQTQFGQQQSLEFLSRSNQRKARLDFLHNEFFMDNIILEKALEKCNDHIHMLKEVGKLFEVLIGRQFPIMDVQAEWKKMHSYLQHMALTYKEKYLEAKALLESDKPIKNMEVTKPSLNIIFPQPLNLAEIYYKGQAKFMSHPMSFMQSQQTVPSAHHQHLGYFHPPSGVPYQGPNTQARGNGVHWNMLYEPTSRDNQGPRIQSNFSNWTPCATSVKKLHLDPHFCSTSKNDHIGQRNVRDAIHGAEFQRQRDISERQASLPIGHFEPTAPAKRSNDETKCIDVTFHSTTKQNYTDSCEGRSTKIVGMKSPENTLQTLGNRQSLAPKKIGIDLLVHELERKFVGVPEFDLLESLQDLRRSHNDTLSGMRIDDILRESEQFVMQRQEKHMVLYSQPKQTSSLERPVLPSNNWNQWKVPSSTPLGQQKKIGVMNQRQAEELVNYPAKVPALTKKPGWKTIPSGLVDWTKDDEDSECTICLEIMKSSDKEAPVYNLPCQHSFHTKVSFGLFVIASKRKCSVFACSSVCFSLQCIRKWLCSNSVCPMCKIHCTMDEEYPPLPS